MQNREFLGDFRYMLCFMQVRYDKLYSWRLQMVLFIYIFEYIVFLFIKMLVLEVRDRIWIECLF